MFKFGLSGIFLSVLVILGLNSFEIVDTGFRGVKIRTGKVVSESLGEDLHFHIPFYETIKEINVQTRRGDLDSSAYSQDAQVVEVKTTLNYNLIPEFVPLTYKEVRGLWEERYVPQRVHGIVKAIVGKYKAVDLIANRQQVTLEIKAELAESLLKKNILLTGFEISNLDLDDQFEEAVKRKVIAVENAKESKNKTVRIREEANQKIIAAEAEAKSMQIRSDALKQSKSLIEYEAIQRWDGKLPTYMLGSGTTPFINLSK